MIGPRSYALASFVSFISKVTCNRYGVNAGKMTKSASSDELFIQKRNPMVLDNLKNEQFSVEELADTYGLSRSEIKKSHRKVSKPVYS